jgi:2-methylcitrate dehydratase
MPLLVEKFKTNLRRRFRGRQQTRILDVSLDPLRLDAMPVNDYLGLYVVRSAPSHSPVLARNDLIR